MKLEFIHFSNFKTYRGEVTLGPLAQLNGIVGGNGSGKSNIIDGIMFALNAEKDKLRVNRMDFLIHGSNSNTPLSNKCSVELEFWEDKTKSLSLKRKLFYNSFEKRTWSDYEINGKNVQLENYVSCLNELNLSGRLNNVVIGQGDVGFIAQMNPQQTTNYLEELAGSKEIVGEYMLLEHELQMCDSRLKLLNKEIKDSLEERKLMEILEEKEHKNNSLNIKLDENTTKKVHLETFKLLSDLSKARKQLTICEEDIREGKRIRDSEEKIKEYNERKQQLLYSKETVNTSLREQKEQLHQKTCNLDAMKNKCRTKSKWLKENLRRQEKYKNDENNVKRRKDEIDGEILKCKYELEEARNTLQSIMEMDQQRMVMTNEFNELECMYNSRNNSLEFSIENKNIQLDSLKNKVEVDSLRLEKIINKKPILNNKIKHLENEIASIENDIKNLESKFDDCKIGQEELLENATSITQTIKEIENKIQFTKIEIVKKDRLKKVAEKNMKTKKIVNKLKNEFGSSILGRLGDLLKCKDALYTNLFCSFIFDMRNAIVVKDFDSILNCIDFINKNNIERTNFLSLDSLQISDDIICSSTIYTSDSFRPLKPLVVSTIEGTEKLVDYICNNILFCDEIDVAVSLRKDNRFDKCKIIIKDGTIFYENRIQLNAMSLNILSETNNYSEKIIELKNLEQQLNFNKDEECKANIELNEIESVIKNIREDIKNRDCIINEKSLEKSKLINELKCLEVEEGVLEKTILKNNQNLDKVKDELNTLIKSRMSLRDDIFHDFMQKYNVKSLNPQDYFSTASDVLKVIHQLQNKINCLQEERKSLEFSVSSEQLYLLEIEIEGVTEEIENLENDIKELSQSITIIKNTIKNNEKSIEIYDSDLKTINKMAKELKSDLDILKADSAKITESLNFQIIDLQEKISKIVRKHSYINVDANFTFESFDKSYLIDTFGESFEDSIDDLFNTIMVVEKNLKKEIDKLDFSDADKLQCEILKETFMPLDNEINEIKMKKSKCLESFKKVKMERKKKFENLYNLLNEKMKEFMYKLFGSFDCSLYIQSSMTSMEPYLGETHIYCQLPRKQLREFSQLSTGEKKIVSLSMILACHQITLSPFLIFDEVDSNVDHEKLKYLVATLRSLQSNVQFIIVSHIEEVFNQCDMIFGTVDSQKDGVQVTNILAIGMKEYN